MKKKNIELKELLIVALASILFAAGYNMFIEPAGIILGGVTGIAAVLNRLFPKIPVGSYILLLNFPLLLLCLRTFGFRFILRSLVGTLLSGVFLDLFSFFPVTVTDPFLCALFGGGAVGAALGLIYAQGYNTGGADLLVFLLRKKFPALSQGLLVFLLDASVVLLSSLVFGDFTGIFYSSLAILSETALLDRVSAGFDRGLLAFIFSKNSAALAGRISRELQRGVTELETKGYYSGEKSCTLLCALRWRELYRLKKIIRETDPHAFSVFADASSISGLGFREEESSSHKGT